METILKWLNKPKADDKSLLARFFHADRALAQVANELDSFDGRTEPERCSRLVTRLRQGQDKVLAITDLIIDELLGDERESRTFRAKFPEEVLQENLAGQLWFGAECLAAGSSIMNREQESKEMRPLAEAVTRSLNNVRHLLRDQCLRNNVPNSERLHLDKNDAATEQLCESLKIFDRLFAEFEWRYVSAMVQVKSKDEYETQELICVLCSETLQRALKLGLLEQDQVDTFDPALMFSIPRLAIVTGLIIYPDGPLNMNKPADQLSEMFRPFRSILIKVREFLWELNEKELYQLEHLLCTNENTSLQETVKSGCSEFNINNNNNNNNNNNANNKNINRNENKLNEALTSTTSSPSQTAISEVSSINNETNINNISYQMSQLSEKASPNRKVYRRVDSPSPAPSTTTSSLNTNSISSIEEDDDDDNNDMSDDVDLDKDDYDDDDNGGDDDDDVDTNSRYTTPLTTPKSIATKTTSTPKDSQSLTLSSSTSSLPPSPYSVSVSESLSTSLSTPSFSADFINDIVTQASTSLFRFRVTDDNDDELPSSINHYDKWLMDDVKGARRRRKNRKLLRKKYNKVESIVGGLRNCDEEDDHDNETDDVNEEITKELAEDMMEENIEEEQDDDEDDPNLRELDYVVQQIKNIEIPATTPITNATTVTVNTSDTINNSNNLLQSSNIHNILLDCDNVFLMNDLHAVATATAVITLNNDDIDNDNDNGNDRDELPTTSAMALQNNDSHDCSLTASLVASPTSTTNVSINAHRSIEPKQADRIPSAVSQETYDLTMASFERYRQYNWNDDNIDNNDNGNDVDNDDDEDVLRRCKCHKHHLHQHHECHDQCGANLLAYGKQNDRMSHKSQRQHQQQQQEQQHYHYYTHRDLYHPHPFEELQQQLEQHNCHHLQFNQRGNNDGYCQIHQNCLYRHHHRHKLVQQQQRKQVPGGSKHQHCRRRHGLHNHHHHHHHHHHHRHSHNNCSGTKCSRTSVEVSKEFVNRSRKFSDTSTSTNASGSGSIISSVSASSNRSNITTTTSTTINSTTINTSTFSDSRNNSKRVSTIVENDIADALNINCPTTIATSAIGENDKEDLNDANALILKRVSRLKFKHTDILLHRLFVCIAGVADQLQTNFAFDLRQILRSVFLMNMTPAHDDDDDDDNDDDSTDGNAVNVTVKSKESELFEFRVTENDVVQQESAGGSSQSLSSAEEVNIEMDINSPNTSSSSPDGPSALNNHNIYNDNDDNYDNNDNDNNDQNRTFRHSSVSNQAPMPGLPNIMSNVTAIGITTITVTGTNTTTITTASIIDCNDSNTNSTANLPINVVEKFDESTTLIECAHNLENNQHNQHSQQQQQESLVNYIKNVDQPNNNNNNNNIDENNQNSCDMNCHHKLIIQNNRYHSTGSQKILSSLSSSSSASCSPSPSATSSEHNSPLYDRSMQHNLPRSCTNVINSTKTNATTPTITTTTTTTTMTTMNHSIVSTAAAVAAVAAIADNASASAIVTEQQQQQQQKQQLKPPAWIPDDKAPRCMSCNVPFTAFRRRHHCRNCGKVFCGMCSNNSAPLPKYGLTKAVRVCRSCYTYNLNHDHNLIHI